MNKLMKNILGFGEIWQLFKSCQILCNPKNILFSYSKNTLYLFLCTCFSFCSFGQAGTIQPKIMVVPFTKDGEDIRTVLDNDVNRRIAITKVKEGFDAKGFTTVDFVGKLKAARDNAIFTSDNQSDIKSKIIEMSGCDIYVVVEVDAGQDNEGASANVILGAYDVSTGNSLANKVGTSGKFYTDDFGKLTTRAVDKCIDEFVVMMNQKFAEIEKKGRSIAVDFSFADGAAINMKSTIAKYDNLALSDVLEDWFSKNSVNGAYHIQGTTSLKMIFDDVKIPLTDNNGNNYTTNKYALDIFKFLVSIGLSPAKDVKVNNIYITLN